MKTSAAAAVLCLANLGLTNLAVADQILQVHNDSLTSYLAGATSVQGVQPLGSQRGTGIDGGLRAAGSYAWMMAGNPFGDAVGPVPRVGDQHILNGTYAPTAVDLALPAPGGGRVVISRTFNGRQVSGGSFVNSNGFMGYNWFAGHQPEIVLFDSEDDELDMVYLVYGADRFLEFKRTSDSSIYFRGVNGAAGIIAYVADNGGAGSEPDTYVYYDQGGNRTWFFGFDGDSGSAAGQFWKLADPAGNTVYAGDSSTASTAISSGYTSGKIEKLFDAAGRRYCMTFATVGGVSRLTQVLAETDAGGGWGDCGAETEVARVTYDYYTADGDSHGMAGDLKLVTVVMPQTDSGIEVKTRTYYRYYDDTWSDTDGRRGTAHQVKMVLGPEGCRRYDYDADGALEYAASGSDPEFLATTDANLKPYSAAYLEYPNSSNQRIVKAFYSGECGCGGGGGANGTYEFSYADNGSFSNTSGYDTDWRRRVVIKQPDAIYRTIYNDEAQQPLSTVMTDGDPGVSYTDLWATVVIRNSSGQVTEVRTPANNDNSYTHSTGSFGTALTGAGLIQVYGRVSSGDRVGLPESVQFKEGTSGTAYFVSWTEYSQRDLNFTTGVNVTRPVVVTRRAHYGSATAYNTASTYDDTALSYAWWSATNTDVLYITPKSVTTTLPAVTTGQNGSNSSNTRAAYLRKDGTTAFALAEDGISTYSQFTSGQLTKRIDDVITNGSFPSGDDPNTDWGITESGSGSDRTTQSTFDAQGRMSTMTAPDGTISKNYYSRLKDGRMVTIAWPRYTSASGGTYFGPASYSAVNHAGRAEFQGLIAITSSGLTDALTTWIDETDADPITALDKGTLARMATSVYTSSGHQLTESRSYFSLPGSGAGSEGTNYDAVRYGYDVMGRKYRTKDATGTITRLVFDDLGRVKETWLGTNDSEEGGSDNIVKVTESTYDGGGDGGNSHLTMVTRFVEDSSTDQRQTSYLHDVRGRAVVTVPPQMPCTLALYDNLGRVTATALYSSSSGLDAGDDPTALATNRVALSRTYYDAVGRVYKATRHKIDQADGSDDDNLETQTWYDAAGRTIKSVASTVTKTVYDRLGRATHRFTCASLNDSAYADADDVSGDKVMEEAQTTYESVNSDNVVMSAVIQRDPSDTSSTGALDSNADGDALLYTAANITGRIQITATWFDDWDRVTDTVAYGTNGGSNFDRDGLSAPTRSDTALRTSTTYNDDGTVLQVEAPGTPSDSSSTSGAKTRWAYDALGRKLTEIRNYVNGTPTSETGADDVYTRFVYSQGHLIKQWVDFDGDNVVDTSDPKDQVTLYIYGATKGTPSQMKIANGNLLRAVVYPDSTNAGTTVAGIDSDSSDVVSFAYNAQGQETYKKDQAGTVLETDYDTGGRRVHHRATALGSGIDNAALRITTAYLSRGLVDTVTQYSSATVGSGSVTDQVQYGYDGWGNITSFVQDVDSVISGGSGRASITVSYTYEKAGSSTTANTLRCTGMSYPGGSDLTYVYGAAASIEDTLSRVGTVKVGAVTVATYKYLGLGQEVATTLNEASAVSDRSASSYANLDRFNRVTTSDWYKDLATDRYFVDLDLTYDRNSNITSITDNINKNAGGNRNFDALYTMDDLNRLSRTDEGTITSLSVTNQYRREDWTLSQVGNWKNHKLDLNGDLDYSDASEFQEDGTFNIVNELTTRELDTNNTAGYETTYSSITYDAAGNLTDDKQTYKYEYDAWGRLRKVKNQSNTLVAEYTYNGLNFRIGWHYDSTRSGGGAPDGTVDANDPWYWFGYDTRWRIVNTFRASDSDPKERFVYHNAGVGGLGGNGGSSYIDAVILRQRDANTSWTASADGTLEQRRYDCQNWRSDTAAVLTDNGKMVEWVKYSSYGVPFGLPGGDTDSDGDWDATDAGNMAVDNGDPRRDADLDGDIDAADITQANGAKGYYTLGRGILSGADNRKGYAGYEYADEFEGSGRHLSHVRNRVLDSDLGRWTRRDPLGYVDGMGLYAYGRNRPPRYTDPTGLISLPCTGQPPIWGGPPGTGPAGPPPGSWPTIPPPNACYKDTENAYCAARCAALGAWGITDCVPGSQSQVCCICTSNIQEKACTGEWCAIAIDCVEVHETCHLAQPCNGLTRLACDECECYQADLACITRNLYRCTSPECMEEALRRISYLSDGMKRQCALCCALILPTQ